MSNPQQQFGKERTTGVVPSNFHEVLSSEMQADNLQLDIEIPGSQRFCSPSLDSKDFEMLLTSW